MEKNFWQNKLTLNIFLFLLFWLESYEKLENHLRGGNLKKNGDKLLFVWQHFRHGARSPSVSNSRSWKDSIGVTWTSGNEELTAIGARMHYLLGSSFRNIYSDFLSPKYNPNEIYVMSTNFNRTIMSVTANLQGIYNKTTVDNLTETQIKNSAIPNLNNTEKIEEKIKEIENQGIEGGIGLFPIRVFSKKSYEFRLTDSGYCPGISKYKKSSEEVERKSKELCRITNDTFGEYIFKFMNNTYPNYLMSFATVNSICDAFIAAYVENKDMTHIRNSGIDLKAFFEHAKVVTFYNTFFKSNGDPINEVSYIAMSPIFRKMFNFMDKRINLNKKGTPDKIVPNSPRYVIMSGHESTLASSGRYLNAEFGVELTETLYASSETFELRRNETDGKYYINYFFNQELKATFDYDFFKNKVLNRIYTQKEIKEICEEKKGGEDDEDEEEEDQDVEVKDENLVWKISFYSVMGVSVISFIVCLRCSLLLRRKD